jgi:hypothetical protein
MRTFISRPDTKKDFALARNPSAAGPCKQVSGFDARNVLNPDPIGGLVRLGEENCLPQEPARGGDIDDCVLRSVESQCGNARVEGSRGGREVSRSVTNDWSDEGAFANVRRTELLPK